jgi:two-component system, sensor histidine kinase ChiS
MSRLLITLICLIFITLPASAQIVDITFQHLSLKEGLSQSTVNCIVQDHRGFLWFGTQDGLNQYDGYQFTVYRHDPSDPYSLSHNEVFALHEDRHGTLWIGTRNGLNRFDREQGQFEHYYHDPNQSNSLSHNTIWSIFEDKEGVLWIGTKGGGLNQFVPQDNHFVSFRHDPNQPNSLSHDVVWPIYEDKRGTLWIGTDGGGLNAFDPQREQFTTYLPDPQEPDSLANVIPAIYEDQMGQFWIGTLGGLYHFDRTKKTFVRYAHEPHNPHSLNDDSVWGISEDGLGNLWIATDGGGLNQFIRQKNKFIPFQHDPDEVNSLSHDAVLSIYKDNVGTIWLGTGGGGVNLFNREQQKFAHYFHDSKNPNSLNNNMILSIETDRKGQLWVGTQGGGLNQFDPAREKVTHYLHDPEQPNSLTDNTVSAIVEDKTGRVWVGTYGGGLNQFQPQTGQFISYRHDPKKPGSLLSDYILSIYEDRFQSLWIGTREGLDQFDPATETFVHYTHDPNKADSLSDNYISVIYEDTEGLLWIGTQGGGLNRFNRKQKQFIRYTHEPNNANSLSHNEISSLYADQAGQLWIGTYGGGLNRFDHVNSHFRVYREKQGLANDVIYRILGDPQGHLWLSSNKGLSKFNPTTEHFRHYDVLDGLQSNEFNAVAHKSRQGEMFFGGINGFNAFYPQHVKDNPAIPPIVITDFKLFNKSVALGPNSPLQQHISTTQEITLSYKQSFFSFEFAALNFLQPTKNEYAYKLKGLDQEWNQIGTQRRANYTNVPHGTYEFHVKGSNNDKVWNETGTTLKIIIPPPPWKTWWAYTLYVITLLAIILNYIRTQKRKLREKQQELEREKAIAAQLRETDRLKDEFLANTSHELRTPLNGIIGIAESLVDGATGELNEQTKGNLGMIIGSGRRLLSLVNDILDFSKLKKKEFDLQLKAVDMHTIAEVVLALTQPLIGRKQVQLNNTIFADLPPIHADENRVQQMLYNLVGNAIKFTDSGTITVSAKIVNMTEHTPGLAITVSDTGMGIQAEKLDRIFEAFEQADGSTARSHGGTGLGLAVTQQLVQLHGGQMTVQSQIGIGSHFTFTLPLSATVNSEQLSVISKHLSVISEEPSVVAQPPSVKTSSVENQQPLATSSNETVPTLVNIKEGEINILIVDDEPVNRQVLVNHLSLQNYTITQAETGIEALELLERGYQPDLILLDVMMPHLSGYEVTQKIRQTLAADELPIILLTAKTQTADLVLGLESGANDYLTKPISKDELLARLKTHLHIQQLKVERLEAEKQYRDIFENAIEGIFQCSPTGRYLSVNPAFVRMLGYESPQQVYTEITNIGQQLYLDPQQYFELSHLLKHRDKIEDFEYQARRRDGSIIWLKETIRVIRDKQKEMHHYEGIIEDITIRKQTEDKLRYDATHDQLTGLLNRAAFTTYLTQTLIQSDFRASEASKNETTSSNIQYAVLFADLDRFKIVNDSMGHWVGDELLTNVARRLEKKLNENDIVARLGGDEFALILDKQPDLETLKQRIDNIQQELSRPYYLKDEIFNTTASIGVALSNPKYKNADEILRDADTAMYEAKKQGGNQSVIFQSKMHTRVVNKLRMERDLHKALEREEFSLNYQPIVSLASGKTISLEALLRWKHPEEGMIRPDIFIPVAEEIGLIKELGLWVFETACTQLRQLQSQFSAYANLGMNINVSPIQLKQPKIVYEIQDIIDKTGIQGPTCRVELTETAMMQNPKAALTVLNDLKNLELLLYVDDFGTGYSSLSYLRQFPIDALKIDKSFIQEIDSSAKAAQIANAIIALGNAFDLRVVAEGVETEPQLAMLKSAQCHHVQGYFYSRPVDAQSIEEYLNAEMSQH